MKNVVALAIIAVVTVAASSCGKEQARRQNLNPNQFGAQQGQPGFNNGGLNQMQQAPQGLQQSPVLQNTNLAGYWYAQANGTLYIVSVDQNGQITPVAPMTRAMPRAVPYYGMGTLNGGYGVHFNYYSHTHIRIPSLFEAIGSLFCGRCCHADNCRPRRPDPCEDQDPCEPTDPCQPGDPNCEPPVPPTAVADADEALDSQDDLAAVGDGQTAVGSFKIQPKSSDQFAVIDSRTQQELLFNRINGVSSDQEALSSVRHLMPKSSDSARSKGGKTLRRKLLK